MFTARNNTFETNSSSTHSLCIAKKSTYEKWEKGDMIWYSWDYDEFYTFEEVEKERDIYFANHPLATSDDWEEYLKYKFNLLTKTEYYDYIYYRNLTPIYKEYQTENGDEIVAFGYYGYDG